MNKICKMAVVVAALSLLAACGDGGEGDGGGANAAGPGTSPDKVSGSGSVYYLNFKPEVAEVYDAIAKDFKDETGIELVVKTAASGTYEQQLTAEMDKSTPPDLFQINGPRGYANWKDYTADLKGTSLYGALTDQSLAVTAGDGVYGVPYVVEGFGIVYNDTIMEKYFALPDKAVDLATATDIKNFADLKAVADDMQAKKDKLGIEGVFAATSLAPGEDWRWQTHLANLPLYYEFQDDNTDLSQQVKEITFKYNKNFQNIFDLYTTDSTTEKALLGGVAVNDSMAEFAQGKVAMVQNGNWAWGQIAEVDGNGVKDSDVKFLPIYTGVDGEESQGICVGTENYFAINSQVSAEQQQKAADFVWWLYSSDTGKKYVTEELGFIAPFDTFTTDEMPNDPLAKQVNTWMTTDGVQSVPWVFQAMPGQTFKDQFGASLLQYEQGSMDWQQVADKVVADWKSESATAEE
ncbi:MAG: ABC transporter substrate-binding protein [Bifidobacteriaceae bacterium]|jgi:raffinose/stachyose/melibiose transport system substrate-binding protein|nr:ABC transporter substrate-binding protein [Bifidobacteriaceae bacterium]